MEVIEWLLESDPAIRWQVMGDVLDVSTEALVAERARVAREGLAARILAAQGGDGAWHRAGEPDWLPTLYMSLLLRATGVDPADRAVAAAIERLGSGFRWAADLGGKPFFQGETEPCINGGALAVGSYFGRPDRALAQRLLSEQLADGGWNCDAPKTTRSSFHSTICVLEGLLEYERAVGQTPEISAARERGHDYMLERGMFRRLSTGQPAHAAFLTLAFPPRCYYDILRGLDYLREAGVAADERIEDAVRILVDKRLPDGRWLLEASHEAGDVDVVGERVGEPSQWNSLRVMRVLRWYEETR